MSVEEYDTPERRQRYCDDRKEEYLRFVGEQYRRYKVAHGVSWSLKQFGAFMNSELCDWFVDAKYRDYEQWMLGHLMDEAEAQQ